VVIAIMLHYGVIIPEENYLEKEFGKDYLEYKKSVRRWL
jgi:protein-S-isoprenylcysteine O-methyltransferase Ste14